MQLSEKKFLFAIGSLLIIFSGIYYLLFSYQMGAKVKAEWWLKNIYDCKDHVASQTKSPKIIIISGSNALFGIDSSIIEARTNFPTLNLAGHVNLDISYLYIKLKEHMKIGDIVVMPLEIPYFQQLRISGWFANNMLAWGEDDYLSKLNPLDLAKFVISVPKSRIYEGILKSNQKGNVVEEQKAISHLEHILKTKGTAWRGYSYTSLNRFGDMISGNNLTEGMVANSRKGFHYYGGWEVSARFVNYYSKIEKLVAEREGRLILTWSVMMKNKLFDITESKYQNRVNRLLANLDRESIYLSCDPKLFQYELQSFFDTPYHLNSSGAVVRSEQLATCINQSLGIE